MNPCPGILVSSFLPTFLQFMIWLCDDCLAVLEHSCSLYSKWCLLPIWFLKESKSVHCFFMLTLALYN
jgi:hypothetical protein